MIVGNKKKGTHVKSCVFFNGKVVKLAFRKNGLLYASKEEYDIENTIDHQIRRVRQNHIKKNIDHDLIKYVRREEKNGRLKWDS